MMETLENVNRAGELFGMEQIIGVARVTHGIIVARHRPYAAGIGLFKIIMARRAPALGSKNKLSGGASIIWRASWRGVRGKYICARAAAPLDGGEWHGIEHQNRGVAVMAA